MYIIVEKARVQIVDSNLPSKLWAKSINTIVYIKNWSPTLTVHENTIMPIQDFYHAKLLKVDYICILESEVYIFEKSDTRLGMRSKV